MRLMGCYVFKFYLLIYGCAGSSLLCGLFSSCGKRGLLSSCNAQASYGVASLVVEHGLWGVWASVAETQGLSLQLPDSRALAQ